MIGKMAGVSYVIQDKHPVAATGAWKEVEKSIVAIKRAQSKFWDL
jgi:hypothetical protein